MRLGGQVCPELFKALRPAHCCAVGLTCHLPGFIPVWTADCGIQQQRGIMGHPSKPASQQARLAGGDLVPRREPVLPDIQTSSHMRVLSP